MEKWYRFVKHLNTENIWDTLTSNSHWTMTDMLSVNGLTLA